MSHGDFTICQFQDECFLLQVHSYMCFKIGLTVHTHQLNPIESYDHLDILCMRKETYVKAPRKFISVLNSDVP